MPALPTKMLTQCWPAAQSPLLECLVLEVGAGLNLAIAFLQCGMG